MSKLGLALCAWVMVAVPVWGAGPRADVSGDDGSALFPEPQRGMEVFRVTRATAATWKWSRRGRCSWFMRNRATSSATSELAASARCRAASGAAVGRAADHALGRIRARDGGEFPAYAADKRRFAPHAAHRRARDVAIERKIAAGWHASTRITTCSPTNGAPSGFIVQT